MTGHVRILQARKVRESHYRENSLRPHRNGRILGILRLRAHQFREASTPRGASLRMTQAKGMEEQHNAKAARTFTLTVLLIALSAELDDLAAVAFRRPAAWRGREVHH